MSWNDLKRKLSSRKFWAAVTGFVTSILYALRWAETDITQMAGIITAAGVLVVYILGEANVDSNQVIIEGVYDDGTDKGTDNPIGFDYTGDDSK